MTWKKSFRILKYNEMDELQHTIAGLESLIGEINTRFGRLSATEINKKPAPGKWSKKEILGHMCDSAMNNIQRLIRAQYEDKPSVAYNQDEWVKCNNYQERSAEEVLELWTTLHRHFIHILRSFPESLLETTLNVGEVVTVRFIIVDYLRHQRHHLAQLEK